MRVLLTRPQSQSHQLAATLRRNGHEPVLSPLMDVRFIEGGPIDLAGVQAIIASSANGIRALAQRSPVRDIPVFAVGPQTTLAAHGLGYVSVKDAHGDSLNLAKAVPLWTTPEAGTLLHPTSSDNAPNLARALAKRGFSVRTELLYETITDPTLTDAAVSHIRAQEMGAVMLFSPRSAQAFAEAVERAELKDSLKGLRAICISAAAAQPLSSLELKLVAIPSLPNQDSMLALLENLA